MAVGPGKYDRVCTELREAMGADAVVVIILNGKRGTGFSMQASPQAARAMPDLLEVVVKGMRDDIKGLVP